MNFKDLAKVLEVVSTTTFDQALAGGNPTFAGDIHAALPIMINSAVNFVGQGIAVVVSPLALTVLQSATTSAFARLGTGGFSRLTGGNYIGTLNEELHVFLDPEADEEVPVRAIAFNKDGDLKVCEIFLKNISFI